MVYFYVDQIINIIYMILMYYNVHVITLSLLNLLFYITLNENII